jgi:hypothetical protein
MRYLSFLLPVLLLLAGFTPPRLKSVKLNSEVSVSLPTDFKVMPDEVIAAKYPAPRKPLGAFSSPNGQVDFIVSERPSTFKADDLAMLQQFYRSTISNTYSEVKFIREEVKEINGRKFIIFEFTSMLRDEERRVSRMAPIRKVYPGAVYHCPQHPAATDQGPAPRQRQSHQPGQAGCLYF